jgi:RimJ/RimL family protein N-acetyltransferase
MTEIVRATEELLSLKPLKSEQPIPVEILIYNQQLGSIINCITEGDLVVGYCMFTKDHSSLNVQIHSDHQQKGYGEMICRETIEEVFNDLKVNEIKIKTMLGRPSNKLAKKLGFKKLRCDDKECYYSLCQTDFKS